MIHHFPCKILQCTIVISYRSARCSCPKELFDLVANEYGEEKAFEYMNIMNEKAPLVIRVNPIKATRNEVEYRYNIVLIALN